MSSGPQFFDILILFIIAILLIQKLRNLLGSGADEDTDKTPKEEDGIILDFKKLDSNSKSELEDFIITDFEEKKPLVTNPLLAVITDKYPDFDENDFLHGAKVAFEMILKAYAQGNTDLLRKFLNDDVLAKFLQAIEKRKKDNENMECQIIGFDKIEILSSELEDFIAKIKIKFVSEQINVIKNSLGETVLGDANYIQNITDIWTFAKDMRLKDPTWTLIATKSV